MKTIAAILGASIIPVIPFSATCSENGGAEAIPGFALSEARVAAAFDQSCPKLILERIEGAVSSIRLALYRLDEPTIIEALMKKAGQGVKVEVKLAESNVKTKEKVLIREMRPAGVRLEIIRIPGKGHMHNKFAVIDGRWVLTGSYNWTMKSGTENRENLVAIESPEIARQYLNDWKGITSPDSSQPGR